MELTDETNDILREIRGLLELLVEAQLPQLGPAVVARLGDEVEHVRSVVKSKTQWDAFALMNGTRTQTDIRNECGMDSGNMSRFVKKLTAEGLVTDADGPPKARWSRWEIEAIRDA